MLAVIDESVDFRLFGVKLREFYGHEFGGDFSMGKTEKQEKKDGILAVWNSKIKHKVVDFSVWRNKNQALTYIYLMDFSSWDLRN